MQTLLTFSFCSQLHQELMHLLTDPLSSCFISFSFFKLHVRTTFSFFFPIYFFILTVNLLNASCREIFSWDKAVFCSDIQGLLQIPFCPGALLSPQTLISFKIPSYPLLFIQTAKINHLLHCSLSLLFYYLVTKHFPQH